MSATFRRQVRFLPGYNYLHETGPKSRGQNGMEIEFSFTGPEGVTVFRFGTMWTPLGKVDGAEPRYGEPCHIDHRISDRFGRFGVVWPPSGHDLGYHWRVPLYDGQDPMGKCSFLGGQPCYYDGSGLRADDVLRRFIAKGEPAVWRVLIDEYRFRSNEARERASDR